MGLLSPNIAPVLGEMQQERVRCLSQPHIFNSTGNEVNIIPDCENYLGFPS